MTIFDIKQDALKNKVPIVKDDTLKVICDLIINNRYKNILELGSGVGYSAACMALINDDIYIDTIEKNDEMYNKAVSNVKILNLDKQITIYHQAIENFIITKKYDFIFIDAAKSQYEKYFNKVIDYLKPNGMILFDNMVFHGLINNVDNIKNRNTRSLVKKIINFRENMLKKDSFDIIINDIVGDGYMLVSRREDGF